MQKNKNSYEEYLNNLYRDIYTMEQAIEHFIYITDTDTITELYTDNTLGTLLREKDPIAFNVGYNEWSVKK